VLPAILMGKGWCAILMAGRVLQPRGENRSDEILGRRG
jgi:hypothetical protein